MQQPEWKGASSQRFSGGRIHSSMPNELNFTLTANYQTQNKGIRTFDQSLSDEAVFKPCLKVYEHAYRSTQNEIDLRGKKFLELPGQRERFRKEKGHVGGGEETRLQHPVRGLRTFEEANKSKNDVHNVEMRMQQKIRILGLDGQRNGLGVTSLGDKIYKYPEYQSEFYKPGGLIPGSTGFHRQGYVSESKLDASGKQKSLFTKPMWNERVKMDEFAEERKAVDSVDEWEQTILKEANPKWNDPDTFFERMEKNVPQGKDAKKIGKK